MNNPGNYSERALISFAMLEESEIRLPNGRYLTWRLKQQGFCKFCEYYILWESL